MLFYRNVNLNVVIRVVLCRGQCLLRLKDGKVCIMTSLIIYTRRVVVTKSKGAAMVWARSVQCEIMSLGIVIASPKDSFPQRAA